MAKYSTLLLLVLAVLALARHPSRVNRPSPQTKEELVEPAEEPESDEARQHTLTQFFEDWAKYMGDFNAADLLFFKINAGEKKVFFEDVKAVPALVRGAYSVSAEQRNKILFNAYDPEGYIIMARSRLKEAIVYFQANKTGKYLLEFVNQNVPSLAEIGVVLFPGRSQLWRRCFPYRTERDRGG